MYATVKELAAKFGCCERTIRLRISEMQESGLYPDGVLAGAGRMKVNIKDFESFLLRKGRINGN